MFIRQQRSVTRKANVARADVVDWANAALEAAGGEAWYKDPISAEVSTTYSFMQFLADALHDDPTE